MSINFYIRYYDMGGLGLSLEIRPGQFIGSWWPAKFGDWVAKRDKLVGINARFDPPPRRAKTQARPARRATRAFSCLMPLLRRRRLSRFARRLGAGSVACPCAAASAPMSSRHCCSHCWSTSWAHPCLGAHAFAPTRPTSFFHKQNVVFKNTGCNRGRTPPGTPCSPSWQLHASASAPPYALPVSC